MADLETTSKHDAADLQQVLGRVRTADSVNIPTDIFEKLYLNPPNRVTGDFRKRFANPTPLGLVGFLAATTPVACQLMGWGGSRGGEASVVGPMYFFGGLLQIIACVLEWFLGNTFSFLVFGTFGAFWLSFAATQQPDFNAQEFFLMGATTPEAKAMGMAHFYSSFAFFLIFFGLITFIYGFCAMRTNAIYVMCFNLITIAIALFAASYFILADGEMEKGMRLQTAAGAFAFVVCILVWYLLVANLFQSLDLPISLPIGDLSRVVKGGAARARAKKDQELNHNHV